MFSIAMHTEFFMFFTTQIGQPLDTSVHALLGGGNIGLLYICILLVTDMRMSLILECQVLFPSTNKEKIQKIRNVLNRLAYIPGIIKSFWGDNHINLEKMSNIQRPSLLHHHKIKSYLNIP